MSEKASRFHSHGKYVCRKCEKSFTSKSSLGCHWLHYHSDRNSRTRTGNTNKGLICSRNRSEPLVHIKTIAGKESYLCRICLVVFRQRSKLKNHVKIHEIQPCIYNVLSEGLPHKTNKRYNGCVIGCCKKGSIHKSHCQNEQGEGKDPLIKKSACYREGHRKFIKAKKYLLGKVDTSVCKIKSTAGEKKYNHDMSSLVKQISNLRTILHKCKMNRKIFTSSTFLQKKFSDFETKLMICKICKKDFRKVLDLLKRSRTAHGRLRICYCSTYRRRFHSFPNLTVQKKGLCEKIESHYDGRCSNTLLRNKRQILEKGEYANDFVHIKKPQVQVQNKPESEYTDIKAGLSQEDESVTSKLLIKQPSQDLALKDHVRVGFNHGREEGSSEYHSEQPVQEFSHIHRKAGSEFEEERGTPVVSPEETISNVTLEDQIRFTHEEGNERMVSPAVDKQQDQNITHQDQNIAISEQGNESCKKHLQDNTLQTKPGCGSEWVTCENPFECPVQETEFDNQNKVAVGNTNQKWSYELPNRQPNQEVALESQSKLSPKFGNEGSSEFTNEHPLQSGTFGDKSMMHPIQRFEIETPVQDTSLNQGKIVLDHENKRMTSEFPEEQTGQESFPEFQRKISYGHENERVQTEFFNKPPGQSINFDYQRRIAPDPGSSYKELTEGVTQVPVRTPSTGYMLVKENSCLGIDSRRISSSAYHTEHVFQCNICKQTFYQEYLYQKHMETFHKEVNMSTNKSYGKPYNLAGGMPCVPPDTSLGKPTYAGGLGPVREQFGMNTMVYKCKFCNLVFGNCEAFQWHLLHAHSKNRFYECYLCGTKYTDRGHFSTHCQLHTQREVHTCTFCKEGLHICEIGFYNGNYVDKRGEAYNYNEQNYNFLYNHDLSRCERTGNENQQPVHNMVFSSIGHSPHVSSCSKSIIPKVTSVSNVNNITAFHRNKFAYEPKNCEDPSLLCNIPGEIGNNHTQKQFNYARYNLENNVQQQNYGSNSMFQFNKGSLISSENLKQEPARFWQDTSVHRIHENVLNVMVEEFVKVEENCLYNSQENTGYENRLLSVVNNPYAHDNSHNPCSSGNIPVWTSNEMGGQEFTQVFDILCNAGQVNDGMMGKHGTEFNSPLYPVNKKRKTPKSERKLNEDGTQEGRKKGRKQSAKKDPESKAKVIHQPHESGVLSVDGTIITYKARMYECNVCHRKFQHDSNLLLHMKVHESNPVTEEGSEEKEEIPNQSAIMDPEALGDKDGIYSCKVCEKQYTSSAEFKQHKSSHWETRLFFCSICKKDFKQYANLVRHKEGVHEGLKPHSCSVCNKSFHTVSQLNIHKNAVHEKVRSYQCDTCPKRFSCKFNMLRHRVKVHEKIKCDSENPVEEPAKKKTRKKSVRARRKGNKDDIDVAQSTDSTSETPGGNGEGDTNMVQQTGETPEDDLIDGSNLISTIHSVSGTGKKKYKRRNKQGATKPHSCDLCKNNFKTLRILKKHMLTYHGSEGFSCNFCGKDFVSVVLLSKHERIHSSKLYECSLCRQKFHRKFLYDRHVIECFTANNRDPKEAENLYPVENEESNMSNEEEETLEKEKPFSCNVCGKKFTKSGALGRHLLYAHPKNKPYSCLICNRGFAGKCHLIIHKKSHTQRRSFDCAWCKDGLHICEEGYSPLSHPKKQNETCLDLNQSTGVSMQHEVCSGDNKDIEIENQGSEYGQEILKDDSEASSSSKREVLHEESQLLQECFSKSPYVLLKKLKTNDLTSTQNTREEKMAFTCDFCSKIFEKAHTLKRHLLFAHPKDRPFSCEICERDFIARCHLIVHAKTHSQRLTYDCELCQRQMHICEKGFHIGRLDRTNSDLEENDTSLYYQEHYIHTESKVEKQSQDAVESEGQLQACVKAHISGNNGITPDSQSSVAIDKPDDVFLSGKGDDPVDRVCIEESDYIDSEDFEMKGKARSSVSHGCLEMSCFECKRVFESDVLYMRHLPCKGVITVPEDGNEETPKHVEGDLARSEIENGKNCDSASTNHTKDRLLLESGESHYRTMTNNSSERRTIPDSLEDRNCPTISRETEVGNENTVKVGYNENRYSFTDPHAITEKHHIRAREGTFSKHGDSVRPNCQELNEIITSEDYFQRSGRKDNEREDNITIANDKDSPSKRTESNLMLKLVNINVNQATLDYANSSRDILNKGANPILTVGSETQNNFFERQQKIPSPLEKFTSDCGPNSKMSDKKTTTENKEDNVENSNRFSSNSSQTSVPCRRNECNFIDDKHGGQGGNSKNGEMVEPVSCIREFQVVDKWMKL